MASAGQVIGLVPVRGGSKGLPGKNMRPLAGVPLYLHAVRQALRVAGRCIVTTDIEDILSAPPPEGCTVLRRPPELAGDTVPMLDVVRDVIGRFDLHAETLLLLQATSPLRSDADLRAVLDLHASGRFAMTMAVAPVDRSQLKFGILDGDAFRPVADPAYCFSNRQALPETCRPNGAAYAFLADAFRDAGGWPYESIGAVPMPTDRSLDIDTLEDFDRVEATMQAMNSEASR
jgi:N-acylneuraminate cytidylyltransferase